MAIINEKKRKKIFICRILTLYLSYFFAPLADKSDVFDQSYLELFYNGRKGHFENEKSPQRYPSVSEHFYSRLDHIKSNAFAKDFIRTRKNGHLV
jgi:hypothetical protein